MGWNHQLGRFGAIFLRGLFSLNQFFLNYGCQLPSRTCFFEVWTFMSNGFRLSHELEGMTKLGGGSKFKYFLFSPLFKII